MVELIQLEHSNISLISHVTVSKEQAALDNNITNYGESLLKPIPGRKIKAFAIRVDENIVGCFRFILPPDESICSISALAIAQEFQGKGYGTLGLKELALYVPANYPKANFLGLSVHPDNLVAKNLYLKLGFELVGVQDDGSETYRLYFAKNS